MTIAFVHNNRAFLPETEAYIQFFGSRGFTCESVSVDEVGLIHRQVEWRLMGTDFTKPREGVLKIHEYSSASIPPRRRWKNWAKGFFNSQPDFRIFLNEYVRNSIGIHDHIPFGFRDMGIPAVWLDLPEKSTEKEFDFLYLGDLSSFREPELLLDRFASGPLRERTLLLISDRYEKLKERYRESENIHFMGPLLHAEVPHYLSKARFAINYIPDKEPFNRQTSTKLLEYCACRIPVISTDYQWVQQFRQTYGGEFCLIKSDLSDLDWESVSQTSYAFPDLTKWTWDYQISQSGILEFFRSRIKGIEI